MPNSFPDEELRYCAGILPCQTGVWGGTPQKPIYVWVRYVSEREPIVQIPIHSPHRVRGQGRSPKSPPPQRVPTRPNFFSSSPRVIWIMVGLPCGQV